MDIPTNLVPSSMMSQPEVIESTAMSEPQCYYNETIAFFYNRSGKYLATEWNTVSKLVMGLGITVCIFIMLANLLVMVAIYVNRRFHFPIYYLMANLAAADFFAGLAYFYLMFNTGPNTRRLTVSTWLLRQGLIDTSLTASVANLLAIAIERHITVFRMQLHTRMSNRRVVVVIVVIWTMAIVMGAIPSVGWNCICDITHCSNMAPLYSDSYLVFWAIFNLVTFVVMVVLYAHIFGYVRQRTMRMSRHSSGPRRNRDTMMSLLKTVVIVLVTACTDKEDGYRALLCFHNLLDPGISLAAPRRLLPAVQRPGLREVLPAPGRVQLCHEPHHLLLPGQGDERDLQADPLLPAQRQCQRPHRRLGPLGVLAQPHHPGRRPQQ
ncbi:lysophosphatidic acid receptor 1 isoform X1 [Anser cygnoides]|uniref:lysophosphatidic acid receptor 1 isoform X1 n=1 Tax=Anser cygnoides TaxID=8845 RepID=UPI0034D29806